MSEEIEEQIEEQIEGMVDKDKKYRNRLIANIKHKKDHPFHNGIHMAAHHLISEDGVKQSGLGSLLEHKGYNINVLENLVFLPSTLQGACHLRVQLHRLDHTHSLPNMYPYHHQVSFAIKKLEGKIINCTYGSQKNSNEIQKLINKESRKILRKIAEFRVALTPIYSNFKPASKVGCSNHSEIVECEGSLSRCDCDRTHIGQLNYLYPNAKTRKVGKRISYSKSFYQLEVGK
ncbi:hypothetical protein EXT47_15095 [Pseudoalteromonas sp. CO342X]|uniref:AHH domain-containing protein n=1 Tax=Pseudoalteromonas sp. CO342X TaxID=1777270 RepID=UPI0010234AC9|nr:AHH domain-containing protein [Pseudoalteromonas sp. CO342X]RZG13941.1 hypothetical protein EXT47_15095 [Pseudoalteromonas sp. CO342X]